MPPKRNHHRSTTGRSKAAAAADAMADCVLPSDIIMFCILTRLPVKSLLRFKSVCKPWRKLFSTPNFIKIHYANFSKLPRNNNFMIYSVAKAANHHTMSLFRIESDEEITNLDHPYPHFFYQMDFVGCCNGLICMAMPSYGQFIILWNPALKLSKNLQLPKVKFGEKQPVSLGFCFDEETADFKVVRIGCLDARKKFRAGIEVYSSNSDSWKKIKTDLKFRIVTTKCDAVVAGNPLWIVRVNENVSNRGHIAWFDVKKMAMKMAPSPDVDLLEPPGGILPLMEWQGSLAAIVCHEIGEMLGGFRVLVFDQDKKVWNMKCNFGPVEMESFYRPLQCSKNEVVIGSMDLDGKLFVIELKTGRVKGIEIEGAEMLSFKIHEYNESLVALDGMKAVEVVKVDDSDDEDDDMDLAEWFKKYMRLHGGGNFPMAV